MPFKTLFEEWFLMAKFKCKNKNLAHCLWEISSLTGVKSAKLFQALLKPVGDFLK
ncbi:MAG: hypothetical protein P1P67_00355 [Treponema phagedenis]|uniref:Uncharacterized protein n=1 Tax=Treponema phagedenis TaxID=162 RepID=A0A0B7H0T8_TREPH|nr:hypothetical protein [Treponema phagedenis]EFW38363.1 hypothetical protein HMPREF9554_01146 [Treponema phagedenis F0421]CEM62511.1 conserved hypothetical protein [Treponema phagedenis]